MNQDKVWRFNTGAVSLTARGNTPSLHKHRNGKRGYLTNAESMKELLERSSLGDLDARTEWTNKILGAVHEQMIRDGRRTLGDEGSTMGVDEGPEWTEQVEEQYSDDASGKLLDPEGVRQARAVEMGHVKELGVYRKVPIQQCWDKTRRGPIAVRWVDINKGDGINPDYRSRLVAKELRINEREDLFAATPPLEAKKTLFSLAVTQGVGWGNVGTFGTGVY